MAFGSKSVSSALAQLGLQSAVARGIGPQEFQRLTGITALEATRPDGRISAAKHIAMLNLTEPKWTSGYVFADHADAPLCGPVSTLLGIVTNAPSLAAAFEAFMRYRAVLGDVDDITIRRDGSDFEFEYRLDGEQRTAISAFGNLLLMARLAKQYTDDASRSLSIELTGAPFATADALPQIAGCPVRFGQARNRLVLHTDLADQPYARHNEISWRILCAQARADLSRLRQQHSFALRVESHLARLLHEPPDEAFGTNPLEMLCDRLAISRSAMHRRLQKEDTNFQSILARVRLMEAKRLLSQPGVAVSEISDTLGFSSPSAFSRFFSDQSGTSPSRFRLANCAF